MRRIWILERLRELDLKQVALAAIVGVSESTVERWVAGTSTPVLDSRNRLALAHALELPIATVNARFGDGEPVPLSLCPDTWDASESDALADLLDGSVPTGPVGRVVHEWLVTPPPQVVELSAGRRIGSGLVWRVEQRVVQLRHLDDFIGGRDSHVLVRRELTVTSGLLRNAAYTEAIAQRLLIAIGELCQLAGWVAADAGENELATSYYGMGVKAAHAAGHRPLAANLVSTLAYHLTNTGSPRDGVLLAKSAVAGAGSEASATTQALLRERVAWALANSGKVKQAELTLAAVESDYERRKMDRDGEPEWTYWLNEEEINTMAARCFVRLGQSRRAIPLLTHVVDRYDPRRARELALYSSWLAEAHVQAGEIEAAAHHAARTAELTAQTTSSRSDDRVRTLVEMLNEHHAVIAVRAFLELAGELGYLQ